MPSGPVVYGGLYWVSDAALSLPPNDDRHLHDRRPVLVISGPETNSDPLWPVVLIMPLSSETGRKTKFCVKVPAFEGNLEKKTWVRVPAVQPLLKRDLQDYLGTLPDSRVDEIQGRLWQYLGMLDEDSESL